MEKQSRISYKIEMLKRVLLEVSFPIDEISRLKGVILKVFISQEHTMKKIL